MSIVSLAAGGDAPPIFRELVIILMAASVVAIVLQRLRFATIPAYLITGALIGPSAIGVIRDPERVRQVAELAMILLMFGVGLHLDLNTLTMTVRRTVALTLGAAAACVLAMWPFASLMGLSVPSGLVATLAMAMSSTAVVLRVLQQRHELGHPDGRLSVAVLIIQDLIAIGVMLLLPPLAKWNGAVRASNSAEPLRGWALVNDLALNGAIAAGGITLLYLLGKYIVPRILTEAARLKSLEVLTVVSAATALGAAVLTQMVGLNPALGAFLAGFLLAATPFRHHLGGQVSAFRDVFAAVFFTAMGMSISLPMLWREGFVILAVTLGVLLIKLIALWAACWLAGASPRLGFRVGVALAQAGEFSIVLLGAANVPSLGLIDDESLSFLIAVVVLSLMVTPSMIQAGAWLGRRIPNRPLVPWSDQALSRVHGHHHHHGGHSHRHSQPAGASNDAPASDGTPHSASPSPESALAHDHPPAPAKRAIIAGFGLVGRVVADKLKSMGIATTIVEMNPMTVVKQTALGKSIVFGDIANADVLESVGIEQADALILTIPDEETVLTACKVARSLNPDIFIVARTSFMSKGITAASLGATGVVVEEMATAEAMETMVAKVLAHKPHGPEPAQPG